MFDSKEKEAEYYQLSTIDERLEIIGYRFGDLRKRTALSVVRRELAQIELARASYNHQADIKANDLKRWMNRRSAEVESHTRQPQHEMHVITLYLDACIQNRMASIAYVAYAKLAHLSATDIQGDIASGKSKLEMF